MLEDALADRIVSLMWRLRRVPVFEVALLSLLEQEENESTSSRDQADLKLGLTIKVFLRGDYSGKLERYETSMQKQLSAALQELRTMQEQRPEAANDLSSAAQALSRL